MKKTLSLLFFLLLSASAMAQRNPFIPIIDYMRTAPAYIDGKVAFRGNVRLYEGGKATLDILKHRYIFFSFKEDDLVVYPQQAITLKYMGLKVNVTRVAWNPRTGFTAKADMPADITGLSKSYVSRSVKEALDEMLGERMKKANRELYRVRKMREWGTTIVIVNRILDIFSTGAEGPGLPAFFGEAGLTFYPKENKVFSVYGMRVGVKKQDTFRGGFFYNGNKNGVYPYSMTVSSIKGLNVNEGKEYKQNMRLVLNHVEMNKNGTTLQLHLGAAETISILLTAAEEIARASGQPVKRCDQCYELAHLPPFRAVVEAMVRENILRQAKAYEPVLRELNVSQPLINSFKKKEACRVNGAKCARQCRLKERGNAAIKTCIQRCQKTVNACLR